MAMGYPICPRPTNPYLIVPVAEEYPLHPPAAVLVTLRPILNCNIVLSAMKGIGEVGKADRVLERGI